LSHDAHDAGSTWRPRATRATLELRARLLAETRAFFAARQVLEVETPQLVNAAVSDVHIHSAEVRLDQTEQTQGAAAARRYFLHTSPEYAMKRLLAAGSGDIYQVCHVFRACEAQSPLHNAEFTLVEWYRLGFTMEALIDELADLVTRLLAVAHARAQSSTRTADSVRTVECLSYQDAFRRELGIDPLAVPRATLEAAAREAGLDGASAAAADRDQLLDFLIGVRIGPTLGRGRLTVVHRYPASQASLAELDPADPRVALRFELYAEGIELANGFRELGSAAEQRRRFEADQDLRRRLALPVYPLDERLLSALDAGLPPASGVALGFDRLTMLAAGAARIDDVLAFPFERA
jgi:lysyl-tRNA synthetase class 2